MTMTPERLAEIRSALNRPNGEGFTLDLLEEIAYVMAPALLAEHDRLKAHQKTVVESAIRLLSGRVCEKHESRIKEQSFAEFMEMDLNVGCKYCLQVQMKSARETLCFIRDYRHYADCHPECPCLEGASDNANDWLTANPEAK